jgi:diguanylate cyclase (GGDEF)-like protein/PAS domain S-box-containing protein
VFGTSESPEPGVGATSSTTDAALAAARGGGHWRRLIDRCPSAIFAHERGRIFYVNAAAVHWAGAGSYADLVGREIGEWVSTGAPVGHVASRSETGAPGFGEAFLACSDGGSLEVHAVSVPVQWEGRAAEVVMLQDLSGHKRAETAERHRSALANQVTDAIITTTPDGIVTSWNPAAEAIYRRPAEQALATHVSDAVGAPMDPAAVIASGGTADSVHRAADGSALAVQVSVVDIGDSYLLISSDRTELGRAARHFQAVVESLAEGIVVFDKNGRITSVNPAALRLFGVDTDSLPVDHVDRFRAFRLYDEHGDVVDSHQRPIIETLRTGETIRHQIFGIDRPDGKRVWMSGGTCLLNADNPERRAVLLSVADVTAQREQNERLAHHAHHDSLTGLPNRAYVLELLTDALTPCDEGGVAAVCYIDLDGFKAINDSLGHHAGDTAIQTAAQLLRAALRAGDIVGRVGGDEFVALLCGPTTQSDIERVTAGLHAAMSQPLIIENVTQRISASIGVAVVRPDAPRSAAQLLRDADHAMYRAKTAGRGQSRFFTAPGL